MSRSVLLSAAALAVAAFSGAASANGRVRVEDASGYYNGSNGSGGAFTVISLPGYTSSPLDGYNGITGDNEDVARNTQTRTFNPQTGNNVTDGQAATFGNSFLSFCLERQDHLAFGSRYYTDIQTSAYDAVAPQGDPNPDAISGTTAKIYREFRSGGNFGGVTGNTTSTNMGNGYNTSDETTAIQAAIWYEEGELNNGFADETGTGGLNLSNAVWLLASRIHAWAAANNDGGLHGVRVLRLWTSVSANGNYSGSTQDLLTLVPLPPAAYAGIGTFAGIFALAAVRRRKLAAE